MKHISFPSIERFPAFAKSVALRATYIGKDSNEDPMYDESLPKPTIKFTGTVKLHGTNAGVCYNNIDGLWCQSRESIITLIEDNAGFARFIEERKVNVINIIKKWSKNKNIDLDNNTISVYFEWAGKGIQKSVGINNIEKSAFTIGVKISPFEEGSVAYWLDFNDLNFGDTRILNINDFEKYEIEIDFNRPADFIKQLEKITLKIEDNCPVTKSMGFEGTGEGVVFTANYENSRLSFKSKGVKHQIEPKAKILNPSDLEKLEIRKELAQRATPEWRLEQMIEQTFNTLNGGQLDIKLTGNYIKNVISDIVKEESELFVEYGLEIKDVNSEISKIAKNFLFEKINNDL